MATAIATMRGLVMVIPFLLHLTVADLLISMLLPLSFLLPQWTYWLSSHIAATVWAHIQHIFVNRNGANIYHSSRGFKLEVTDNNDERRIVVGEPALILSNHQSWADFYLLQSFALSTSPNMLPYARYFAKSSLRFVPLLGWGLWALRMPLVSRRWVDDQSEIERVFRGPRERKEPIWLVMFCEGTRWTKRKWEEGVAWARSKGKPEPGRYVLAPRSKGFVASVRGLREGGVKCVIDFTLAYASREAGSWVFMKAPDMWTTLSKPAIYNDHAFWVHAERLDITKLPIEEKELEKWLEERWRLKSDRLEKLGLQVNVQKNISDLRL